MSFSPEEVDRYARHLVLREIGGPGQQRLSASRVLVIGVGGLGSPAALYLAAAGVGVIGLADPDVVSLSNLQRQVLFATADVDAPKVAAAAAALASLNPHVAVRQHAQAMDEDALKPLLSSYDLVLDGTDTFSTRLAVNAACVNAGTPLVSGAIGRWTGQVGVFRSQPCYQCLVPEPPADIETCAAVGVIGALAGVVGSMMALEAVKTLTGAGDSLSGRLLIYEGLTGESRTVRIAADPTCPICS